MATRTVADVMTERVVSVSATAPVREAAEAMRDNDIGDVIVVEDGSVRGILTDRDVVVRVLAGSMDPSTTVVADVYSGDLVAVRPETPVDDAVRTMRERAVRRLAVVDANGHPAGMVSIGDFAASEDPRSALADISTAQPNT